MRRYISLAFVFAVCGWVVGTVGSPVVAQNAPPKMTVMVPMRDGVHLATDIRLPAGNGPWPVALVRTP